MRLVENLTSYLGADAENKGVDFITDLPEAPVLIHGLEARLAQVFVNLITNAISFCEEGDAIRVWIRIRENRVLVVVEDTGPGIQKARLGKYLIVFTLNVLQMILAIILDLAWPFPNRLLKHMMGRFGLKIFVQHKWTPHLHRLVRVS